MKIKKTYPYPTRAADVPVTQKMLYAVRDELKADINGVKYGQKSFSAEFKALETEVKALKTEFRALKTEFKALTLNITAIDAKVESRYQDLSSEIHQIKILMEEQNAKNNIVLDGLVNLFERQERLESR